MPTVKFTIPKGSLEKATFGLLEEALYKVYGQDRTYRPVMSDREIELKVLRPQEIPVAVAEGLHDIGITGKDWIEESGADVEPLLNLEYGRVRLVVVFPKSSLHSSLTGFLEDYFSNGRTVRISTEYLNISSRYLMSNPAYRKHFGSKKPMVITPWWRRGSNSRASIYLSFGATEAKPPDEADIIFDLIETGTTLEQNNLKAVETIMESNAWLIANRASLKDSWKREKIYDIMAVLRGAVDSKKKLHIFVNVRRENLKKLLKQLPALKRPSISPLSDEGWYAVNTIIEREDFFKLLPTLRKLAQGLVVHQPRQILSLEELARNQKSEKESKAERP